jgi:hypothetical protein
MSHRTGSNEQIKCKMCGKCCVIFEHGVWSDCKYLIRYLPSSTGQPETRCSIYPHRSYAIIGEHSCCVGKRERIALNYPGCPFNKSGQSLHRKYIKDPSVSDINETKNASSRGPPKRNVEIR